MAGFSPDRDRLERAETVQASAWSRPVPYQSGKLQRAHVRSVCDKHFAPRSIHWHEPPCLGVRGPGRMMTHTGPEAMIIALPCGLYERVAADFVPDVEIAPALRRSGRSRPTCIVDLSGSPAIADPRPLVFVRPPA